MLCDRFAQLRQTRRGPVMGESFAHRVRACVDDVARRIEIRLADLEMNDVAALCLQCSRLHQYFEGGLGPETRHAFGEAEFVGLRHEGEIKLYCAAAQLVFL